MALSQTSVPKPQSLTSSGLLPAATPVYILRGHSSPIHSLTFSPTNAHLVSADAQGWLIIWDIVYKRPIAVWQAHESVVMEVKYWGSHRLVTHGRDHRVRVWSIREADLARCSKGLPMEDGQMPSGKRNGEADEIGENVHKGWPQPWLLHSMAVNSMNFCGFDSCYENEGGQYDDSILLATPDALDSGGVDFFQLPSEHRLSVLPSNQEDKTGMVMALRLLREKTHGSLTLIVGYEDGRTAVYVRSDLSSFGEPWNWQKTFNCKAHSQPVLGLDAMYTSGVFLTSSADANIAKGVFPSTEPDKLQKIVATKHAGQQGLTIRSDDKIFATAGWDKMIRVYSMKTLRELAVLKWHKEGCYAVAFAKMDANLSGECDENSPEGVSSMDKMKLERAADAQQRHWLAAGGKDGKISLWDIY